MFSSHSRGTCLFIFAELRQYQEGYKQSCTCLPAGRSSGPQCAHAHLGVSSHDNMGCGQCISGCRDSLQSGPSRSVCINHPHFAGRCICLSFIVIAGCENDTALYALPLHYEREEKFAPSDVRIGASVLRGSPSTVLRNCHPA